MGNCDALLHCDILMGRRGQHRWLDSWYEHPCALSDQSLMPCEFPECRFNNVSFANEHVTTMMVTIHLDIKNRFLEPMDWHRQSDQPLLDSGLR